MRLSASVIGLFDSGIGGTTVLREVRLLLPDEPLLYLADQARCPYGPNDDETLRRFALDNTQWLLDRGAKLIVVACNTASAAALHWLRERFPGTPFVGMVPAVKPAAQESKTGVVGVLATPATMQGRLLRDVMERWTRGVTVVEQVALGLVELIEAGRLDDDESRALLWRYLAPMVEAGADTVVLGCTHYPYLAPLMRELAPTLQIIDAAPAVARQVARVLHDNELAHPTGDLSLHYATTRAPTRGAPTNALRDLLDRLSLPEGTVGVAEGHPAVR
ncbi:MAG: glutamate racemase [Ardenticatenaceae bacterium]